MISGCRSDSIEGVLVFESRGLKQLTRKHVGYVLHRGQGRQRLTSVVQVRVAHPEVGEVYVERVGVSVFDNCTASSTRPIFVCTVSIPVLHTE